MKKHMHKFMPASGANPGLIGLCDLTFRLGKNTSQIGLSFCKTSIEIS